MVVQSARRGRHAWGRVRRLPSGRWQVRYPGPDGRIVSGGSYRTKADAEAALAVVRTDQRRGAWVDPRAGRVTLADYANRWLANRPDLRPTTVELYRRLLDRHILPALGRTEMGRLSPAVVRNWWAELAGPGGPGPAAAAHAYRLLRAVLNTALADELIVKNPCVVRGAGQERSAERPVATVAEVGALADAMPERLAAAVLLAAWCGLRRGELFGLRRRDLDLMHGLVKVERAANELRDGSIAYGPPKTEAGRRHVAIPPHLLPTLAGHLDRFVAPDPDALLFTGAWGGPLRSQMWRAPWDRARRAIGLGHIRLHDLRHSGNTWAAATGASTRELMARMGHASPAAALRYQHATADRDRAIAAALSGLARAAEVRPIHAAGGAGPPAERAQAAPGHEGPGERSRDRDLRTRR